MVIILMIHQNIHDVLINNGDINKNNQVSNKINDKNNQNNNINNETNNKNNEINHNDNCIEMEMENKNNQINFNDNCIEMEMENNNNDNNSINSGSSIINPIFINHIYRKARELKKKKPIMVECQFCSAIIKEQFRNHYKQCVSFILLLCVCYSYWKRFCS